MPDIDPFIEKHIRALLEQNEEAATFVIAYRAYVHMIDDLIDDTERPTAEQLLKVFAQASVVYSQPFWLKNSAHLIIVEQLINNTYADSVKWEKAIQTLLIRDAAVLRHTAIDMFFAVWLICFGRDSLREISSQFRQYCHECHVDKEGNFV